MCKRSRHDVVWPRPGLEGGRCCWGSSGWSWHESPPRTAGSTHRTGSFLSSRKHRIKLRVNKKSGRENPKEEGRNTLREISPRISHLWCESVIFMKSLVINTLSNSRPLILWTVPRMKSGKRTVVLIFWLFPLFFFWGVLQTCPPIVTFRAFFEAFHQFWKAASIFFYNADFGIQLQVVRHSGVLLQRWERVFMFICEKTDRVISDTWVHNTVKETNTLN